MLYTAYFALAVYNVHVCTQTDCFGPPVLFTENSVAYNGLASHLAGVAMALAASCQESECKTGYSCTFTMYMYVYVGASWAAKASFILFKIFASF